MTVQQGQAVQVSFFNRISKQREQAHGDVLSVEPLRVKCYGSTLVLGADSQVQVEKVLARKPYWA